MKNNKFKTTILITLAIFVVIGSIMGIFISNNKLKITIILACSGILNLLNGFNFLKTNKKQGIISISFSIVAFLIIFYKVIFKLI
jgi:hypothetical protein